jgi:hypothetical protein
MQNESLIEKLVNELVDLGAQATQHGDRTLLEHLEGVFHLLDEWGNPLDICLAGLFHSIYGTTNYKTQTISFKNRGYIQDLIGKNAENFVFLFCVCDVKDFIEQCHQSDPFRLIDTLNHKEICISEKNWRAIAEIHIANLLEQLPSISRIFERNKLSALMSQWLPATSHASIAANNAFKEVFRDLEQ